jgi:hypothetical protein
MRCERIVNSGAGAAGGSQNVHFCAVGLEKAIKHFEDILFWAGQVVRMTGMIKLRHQQPSLGHRGLAEDIEGLWEPWMRLVDQLFEDEQLVDNTH